MGIKKGESWGVAGRLPPGAPVATTDSEAAGHLAGASGPVTVGLLGGDLCRTVGGRGDQERMGSEHAQTLPCDAIEVLVDGVRHLGVAHCVLRRSWWAGELVVIMNAAWMGDWNMAPRAHPGDSRLDVLSTEMAIGDRLKARNRLRHGGHVPHPAIKQRRITASANETFVFSRPVSVYLDGAQVASSASVDVSVVPDAFFAVV